MKKAEAFADTRITSLLGPHRGQGVFGHFDTKTISVLDARREFGSHGIRLTRKYLIKNLLRNSPFGDCDADVTVHGDLTWTITHGPDKIHASAGVTPGSLIEINPHDVCPVGRAALAIVKLLLGDSINVPRASALEADLHAQVDSTLALLVQQITNTVPVLGSTMSLLDMFVDGDHLTGRFQYDRFEQ
jgi:hypothetical protein